MSLYEVLLVTEIIAAPIVLVSLLYVSAPYGRHSRPGWGLQLDNRLAWVLMELPAVITMAMVFVYFQPSIKAYSLSFLLIWEFHYLYRTFIFPLYLRGVKKNFPLMIVLFAVAFNVVNGYINGYFLFRIRPVEELEFFLRPAFLIGFLLFVSGFTMHVWSDRIISQLRKGIIRGYGIPYGGAFRWITNPNYLGEFIQWTGWAILTWSVAGLAFALFTLANLLPRALANHRWYREKFPDYPSTRKAFFPFII